MSHTAPFAAKIAIADAALDPWPLPEALVAAGAPRTAGKVLSQSSDGCIVRGIWECTPGSFRWDWSYDETIVVVSGHATVHVDGGPVVELRPGDLAFFERGQTALWTTQTTFRKAFHAHSPVPLPF